MTEETPDTERVEEVARDIDETDLVSSETLFEDLTTFTTGSTLSATNDEVGEMWTLLAEATDRGLIDSELRDLQASDAAEAFVGSVIVASPLLVEDGVFDIADVLFGYTLFDIPVFLIANTLFVVLMTYALLEWTGRNREETRLIFGVFPMRVVMVLGVSFVVASILMTVWGRVGDWQPPAEAIARINVLWTVGSLGAALGDILSEDAAVPAEPTKPTTATGVQPPENRPVDLDAEHDFMTDSALVDAIHAQFDELAAAVDSVAERQAVERLREETIQATLDTVFVHRIRKYTGRDIAEAFVGSIFFSIPFLVEDGVYDVAEYFLSFRIGAFPVFFLANTVFVLGMIWALVYWAGPREVAVSRPILGFLPRRMVGIGIVSFLTAAALMTLWGRLGNWSDPVVAIARISVVWAVASFGAALGDILPGESSGDDIYDELEDFGDLLEGENDRGADGL